MYKERISAIKSKAQDSFNIGSQEEFNTACGVLLYYIDFAYRELTKEHNMRSVIDTNLHITKSYTNLLERINNYYKKYLLAPNAKIKRECRLQKFGQGKRTAIENLYSAINNYNVITQTTFTQEDKRSIQETMFILQTYKNI